MLARRPDVVCGRAPGAWRRACARKTVWLRDFATASAWIRRWDPIDLAKWTALPFGVRLAELTGTAAVGARATTTPASSRRPSFAQWPIGGQRSRNLRAEVPCATQRSNLDIGATPSPPRSARLTGIGAAQRRGARHKLGAPATGMTRARIAALAGDMTRALRAVTGRSRAIQDLPSTLSPSAASYRGWPNATKREAANAEMYERARRRVTAALSRAFGQPPTVVYSWATGVDPIGWTHAIAPPDPGLAMIAADTPVIAMPSSLDHEVRGISRLPAEGRQGGSRSAEPAATPQTVRRAVADGAEGEAARLDGSDVDKSGMIASPLGAARLPMPRAEARREGAPAQEPLKAGTSPRQPDRPRFDREEFAEHLRIILIEDARRLGIDV
jgi:hypothetical protein